MQKALHTGPEYTSLKKTKFTSICFRVGDGEGRGGGRGGGLKGVRHKWRISALEGLGVSGIEN